MSTQSNQVIKRKLRNPDHNPVDWTYDTLVANIVCNKCGNTLPPHTIRVHLDETNKIHSCPHTDELNINAFQFDVTSDFIDLKFIEHETTLLSQPSGLTNVLLCSDWCRNKFRELDFTGTTCEQAIKKILTFYKHKTYRRLLDKHTFVRGVKKMDNGMDMLWIY